MFFGSSLILGLVCTHGVSQTPALNMNSDMKLTALVYLIGSNIYTLVFPKIAGWKMGPPG